MSSLSPFERMYPIAADHALYLDAPRVIDLALEQLLLLPSRIFARALTSLRDTCPTLSRILLLLYDILTTIFALAWVATVFIIKTTAIWLTLPNKRVHKIVFFVLALYFGNLHCASKQSVDPVHPTNTTSVYAEFDSVYSHTTIDKTWFITAASASIKGYLREPTIFLTLWIFLYVTFGYFMWFLFTTAYGAMHGFVPMFDCRIVDWWFPPTTIYHKFRTANGYESLTARDIRSRFTPDQFMLDRAYLSSDPNHTHPYAARRRLAAINMIEAFCKRNGLIYCDDQMSNRSAKHEREGTRVLADAKDSWSYTAKQLRWWFRKPSSGAVIAHSDTFTHKDLRDANITLSDDNIHFLYTWNPTAVAGTSDELSFRYDEEGSLITTCPGSADYKDNLWDFEGDGITTNSWEFRPNKWTVYYLVLAAVMFYYNQYCDWHENSDLHPFGNGYWRWYEYRLHFPTFYIEHYNYTHHGIAAALGHFFTNFGLPSSWWLLLHGQPYLWVHWHGHHAFHYPHWAEPVRQTWPQFIFIMYMLFVAIRSLYTNVVYSHRVLRIDLGEHRSAVLIVPSNKFEGPGTTLRPFLQDASLKRRKPTIFETQGGHTAIAERFKKQGLVEAHFSAAFLHSHVAHVINDNTADTTKSLTTEKSDPSLSNVRVSTKAEGDEVTRNAAALSIALHHLVRNNPTAITSYSYTPVPTIIRCSDEEASDGVVVKDVQAHRAMTPIVTGCDFIHAKSHGAYVDTVKRRLRAPADEVKGHTMTPKLAAYVHEFAGHIRRDACGDENAFGWLELYDEDRYINERNNTQLRKFQDVQPIYDVNNIEDRKGFLKREVLAKPYKPARGICTFPPESQAIGGRIALAYAEALKACSWIGCGQNPREITEAVTRVCSNQDFINATDFTAQDATVTLADRAIELFLLKSLFHEDWHDIIENWHWTDYCGCVIYGDPGAKKVPHDFDGSRGSGSPFTTFGNTPLTGLYAYVALREQGFDPSGAYAKLGIYSGDDGITANVQADSCEKAAEIMGFIVKSDICETHIPYLGRIFHDPIHGSTSSIQDPLRTLGKLATTLCDTDQIDAHEAMLLKAICLRSTDAKSEFFGDWSAKMLKDAGEQQINSLNSKVLKFKNLHPYFAITALKTGTTFDNNPGDFEELFEEQMPGFDWSRFKQWRDHGEGQCPTLWSKPEPTDEQMCEVGPVAIGYNGVTDESQMIVYDFGLPKAKSELSPPPVATSDNPAPKGESAPNNLATKEKKKKRSPAEQKTFMKALKKNKELYDKYCAAQKDDKLSSQENSARAKTRREIESTLTQSM